MVMAIVMVMVMAIAMGGAVAMAIAARNCRITPLMLRRACLCVGDGNGGSHGGGAAWPRHTLGEQSRCLRWLGR